MIWLQVSRETCSRGWAL